MDEDHDGCAQKRTQGEIQALLEEYVPGLVQYEKSRAAGHYLLRVSADGVFVDFFACDSVSCLRTYQLK